MLHEQGNSERCLEGDGKSREDDGKESWDCLRHEHAGCLDGFATQSSQSHHCGKDPSSQSHQVRNSKRMVGINCISMGILTVYTYPTPTSLRARESERMAAQSEDRYGNLVEEDAVMGQAWQPAWS